MQKIRQAFEKFFFALPVQLVVMQVRHHKSILLFWLVLFLTIFNQFGSTFGIPFLFLEPEYLGKVSFWSMFLMGIGFGFFGSSYMIATYILDSYRFHFLALKSHPFFTFSLNNSLIPIAFLLTYLIRFWQFQMEMKGGYFGELWWLSLGFVTGIFAISMFLGIYFQFTNTTVEKSFTARIVSELRSPWVILDKARAGLAMRYRVDSYFSPRFRWAEVDKSKPADFRRLVKVLNQNHGNALLLQGGLLLSIVLIGLLEEKPVFQVPSGMSILMVFSIILMLTAAFTFWFRKIGMLTLLIAGVALFVLDWSFFLKGRHPAFGMNYEVKAAEYSPERLKLMSSDYYWDADYRETLAILERWKSDYQIFHGPDKKPKAVLVAVSGGGLRSTYFTMRSMQILDSLTNGEFVEHTRLMGGASGGMIGAGIYRELSLKRRLGLLTDINSRHWAGKASQDLLNRVSMKIVTGLLLPGKRETIGSRKYLSGRGYSFDNQLIQNLGILQNKRMGDYRMPEQQALIPMMVLSPVIVGDGRKLYISSTPVTYLTRPRREKPAGGTGIVGVDFSRYFQKQGADSLLFVTALRMNASFPMITPYVQLPSEPPIEVIDAGMSDNYGIQTVTRFLHVYRDWFMQNTSGVLLLQIRDSERNSVWDGSEKESLFSRLTNPVGAAYQSFATSKEIASYENLEYLSSWYQGELSTASIEYILQDSSQLKASLSWHLTQKEKETIEESLNNSRNQQAFNYVADWLKED